MRNLKKILALVLALVMSMSLVVTANAFSDDDAINEVYREAATVLDGLKVLQGRDDGSFDPKAPINRAEVAAIIYRIVTGDVENKQTNIYSESAYGLSDVNGWYNGYVGFCYNSKYIKGYTDGTFKPMKTVTGHEALAMLLRAIGYGKNGEFEGSNWALNTAARAKALGLIENINEGLLSQPATREMVAEMAFRAMTVEMVDWSLGLDYRTNGRTLGDTFKLVEFNGVITANEYADLYDVDTLAAGKTKLDDETTYTWTTALTDMGEARHGWAAFANKTVLFSESTCANAWQTGAATDNLKKASGISVAGAEDYVNFGGYKDDLKAEMLISYSTTGFAKDAVKISEDKTVTAADLTILADIFDHAKYEDAWVIVGTKVAADVVAEDGTLLINEKNSEQDISNDMSFKKFKAEYTYTKTEDDRTVESTGNGDWLKIIDNDGDGSAEYVFQTKFGMAEVAKLSKKGVLSFSNTTKTYGDTNDLPFITPDELEAGDVVLITEIDGKAYVNLAPTFEGKVDKYTYKTDVLTVEGEDYGHSIIATDDPTRDITGYENNLENADKKVNYTYFKDHFGYIVAFGNTASYNGLTLLTDAYFETNRNNNDYAVRAYMDEELNDLDDGYTVASKYTGGFINTNGDDNDWDNLVAFGAYTGHIYDEATTNLARYSLDDSNVISLETAKTYSYKKNGDVANIRTDYVNLDEKAFANSETEFTGYYAFQNSDAINYDITPEMVDDGEVTVQANRNTVFYYVDTLTGAVQSVVGFRNSIGVDDVYVPIVSMYAVATNTADDAENDPYWVADAIVIETYGPAFELSYDVVLGYDVLNKTVRDYADMAVVDNTGKTDEVKVTKCTKYGVDYDVIKQDTIDTPEFYFNNVDKEGDSYIRLIDSNFDRYGIYAAQADRVRLLNEYVTTVDNVNVYFDADTLPVYDLEQGTRHVSITDEDARGDKLVLEDGEYYLFYAPKNARGEATAVYAILIDCPMAGNHFGRAAVEHDVACALYDRVYLDATTVIEDTTVADALKAAAAALAADPQNIDALKTALETLKGLTGLTAEEAVQVAAMIEALENAIDAIEKPVVPEKTAKDYAEALLLAYQNYETEDAKGAEADADKLADLMEKFMLAAAACYNYDGEDAFDADTLGDSLLADYTMVIGLITTGGNDYNSALGVANTNASNVITHAGLIGDPATYIQLQNAKTAKAELTAGEKALYLAINGGTTLTDALDDIDAALTTAVIDLLDRIDTFEEAYDAWDAETLQTEKDKLWPAVQNAYDAITADERDEIVTDGSITAAAKLAAVEGVQDVDAVFDLKLTTPTGTNWGKWDSETLTLVVAAGFAGVAPSDYLEEGDNAVGTLTFTAKDTETTYKTWTVKFEGANDGADVSKVITVRNATPTEKADHNEALVAEYIADLAGEYTATDDELSLTDVAGDLEAAITAALKLWGTVTVEGKLASGDSWNTPTTTPGSATNTATFTVKQGDVVLATVELDVTVNKTV